MTCVSGETRAHLCKTKKWLNRFVRHLLERLATPQLMINPMGTQFMSAISSLLSGAIRYEKNKSLVIQRVLCFCFVVGVCRCEYCKI
jgi:hypothetical protein